MELTIRKIVMGALIGPSSFTFDVQDYNYLGTLSTLSKQVVAVLSIKTF